MTKTNNNITTIRNILKKIHEDREIKFYNTSRGGFIIETKRYVGVSYGDFKTYFFKANDLVSTSLKDFLFYNKGEEIQFKIYRKKNKEQELWFPEIYDAKLLEIKNINN